MKQSHAMSLVEAVVNVVVGYVLAIATQIVVFPWFGIETGLAEHMTIGFAFVGVSLARSYLLRRLFEAIRVRQPPITPPSGGEHEPWISPCEAARTCRTPPSPCRRASSPSPSPD